MPYGFELAQFDRPSNFVRVSCEFLYRDRQDMGGLICIGVAVESINALERELKARVPQLKWLFIEPDVED